MGLFQKEHDELLADVKQMLIAHDLNEDGPHYPHELEEAAREVILVVIDALMELYEFTRLR